MEPRATDSAESIPPTPASFGNWLRRRRKALDLTQEQLAHRVGCARVTVKRIEADELVPSKQLASLLAEQVGIPAGEREAFIRFARSGHPVESVAQVFESATPTPWQVHPQPFNQLPLYLTSFVGRDKEIAEASKLLATHRLVTFIGPGGIGKTRLAVQVAANEKASGFPHGVWLVELAALTDASSVPRAVATALGLHEEAGVAIANGLTHFIGEKKSLLALDNCEHLIKACAELAEILLRANPNLCILATSREALGVAGEKVLHLTGLALPRAEIPLSALLQFEATRLFLERAQAVLPTFEFTNENAAWVLGVCQRLDGIPLALELAAARVKLLSVEQIAARLDDRFNLLTMGSRTALPRQQTLRATIDWSYELLTASERVLLQRLSVFVGGWTIEAAEQVGAGDEIEGGVLDLLSQLVNKSLVEVGEGSPPRYRLLETIQEYAREKLVESGESDKTRTRHLRLFLNLAEEAEPHLNQANQLMWYGKLDTEYANLRAAIQWALESGRAEDGSRLTGALVLFWMGRGVFSEARKWLEATLASGRGASDSARVKVLQGLGATMRVQGDRASAHNFLEESLAMSRTLNDKKDISGVLCSLALLALEEGDNDLARKYLEESLALGRELDDKWTIAYSLNLLGIAVRNQGDYDSAKSLWHESMRMLKELGSERQLAFLLVSMGDLAAREGNFSTEERMYEQALEIRSKLKDKAGIAQSLGLLGFSALHQRNLVRATALTKESLVLQNEIGIQAGILRCLVQFAFIAVEESKRKTVRTESSKQETTGMNQVARRSQLARAVRLVAATERRHDSLLYRGLDNLNRAITLLRSELDQAAFASAWAEGQAMTLEQAIAYALEETLAAKET